MHVLSFKGFKKIKKLIILFSKTAFKFIKGDIEKNLILYLAL